MDERDGQRGKWKLINDENGGVGLSARTCSGFQIEISRFRIDEVDFLKCLWNVSLRVKMLKVIRETEEYRLKELYMRIFITRLCMFSNKDQENCQFILILEN